jgi:hypothetical protein
VGVAEFFSFREDWHQDERAIPLVRQYQQALTAALADHPDLANCAVCCCHCGIRFLTHPRNAGRMDLGCPFGCRAHHRRQLARQRSRAHYRTEAGRRNKKRWNAARQDRSRALTGNATPAVAERPTSEPARASRDPSPAAAASLVVLPPLRVHLPLAGFVLDEPTLIRSRMIPYLLRIVPLLEGRPVTREELLGRLRKSLRQRSIARLSRREYVLRYLQQHPP